MRPGSSATVTFACNSSSGRKGKRTRRRRGVDQTAEGVGMGSDLVLAGCGRAPKGHASLPGRVASGVPKQRRGGILAAPVDLGP